MPVPGWNPKWHNLHQFYSTYTHTHKDISWHDMNTYSSYQIIISQNSYANKQGKHNKQTGKNAVTSLKEGLTFDIVEVSDIDIYWKHILNNHSIGSLILLGKWKYFFLKYILT